MVRNLKPVCIRNDQNKITAALWFGIAYFGYDDGWAIGIPPFMINYISDGKAYRPFSFSNIATNKRYFSFGWYL
jgi:hypothetical protein